MSDPLRTSLPSTHAAASPLPKKRPQTGPSRPAGNTGNSTRTGTTTRPETRPGARPGGSRPGGGGGGGGGPGNTTTPQNDPRHMAIALHHAHRIQAQKDTEALILDRILDLVAFPGSSTADPSSPSPEDTRVFKDALVPFQPADYDNLIQERNIEGLCGYGLCPREHRSDDRGGRTGADTFRIRYGAKGSGPGGRGREMNIVPKKKWEMWCSDECAERALYLRVQLAEEPVWERRGDTGDTGGGGGGRDLVLLEEGRGLLQHQPHQQDKGKAATVDQVSDQLGDMHMHDDLALERGDSTSSASMQNGRVDVHIKENVNLSQANVAPPQLRPEDSQGGSIEGHVPKPE